jgi:hypothetical protein
MPAQHPAWGGVAVHPGKEANLRGTSTSFAALRSMQILAGNEAHPTSLIPINT